MGIVDCLKCVNSACCKLVIEVDKEEYEEFNKKGLSDSFITRTDEFLKKRPKYESKRKEIDEMYIDNYAELKKADSGLCVFLGEDMLCSIYADRPKVCRDYQTSRCESIRCIK